MRLSAALTCVLFSSMGVAQAQDMVQIGDGETWLNPSHIVYIISIDREQARRVNLGFLSIRGDFEEDYPEETKFCSVGTLEHSWTFAIDCREILEAID